MPLTKKLVLWLACLLTACQAFPISLPLPISTVTPTNTPGPAPTTTPLPTSTPLPAMEPVVRIDTGDKALFFGDYDLAREQYLTAFNDTTDNAIKAAALWAWGAPIWRMVAIKSRWMRSIISSIPMPIQPTRRGPIS